MAKKTSKKSDSESLDLSETARKSLKKLAADYEEMLKGMSNLPDYAKLFSSIRLPEVPDYAKLFADIKLGEIPDYTRLFENIQLPEIPDYAKMFESIQLPEIPDYAKLAEGLRLPEGPSAAKLLEGLRTPDVVNFLAAGSTLRSLSTPTERMVTPSADQINKLRKEIDELRETAAAHAKALRAATDGSDEQKLEIEHLKSIVEQFKEKQRLGFLLERVHPDAQKHLLQSREFQEKFLSTGECSAFVMSVDIRRSTELMLKARTAEQFADFIRHLCFELTAIVVKSLGVFDKFTGDGVLAFFPDFFTGPDAAYRVVAAADECHAAFERHYRSSRTSFKSVLTNVGLGIGIDYGFVRLVQVAGGLTVVGEPVVYACRLSSAPPGKTLSNQPAFEQVSAKCGGFCFAAEQDHEIKHEGSMLAYEVRLNGRGYMPAPPEWLKGSPDAENPKPDQKDHAAQ